MNMFEISSPYFFNNRKHPALTSGSIFQLYNHARKCMKQTSKRLSLLCSFEQIFSKILSSVTLETQRWNLRTKFGDVSVRKFNKYK